MENTNVMSARVQVKHPWIAMFGMLLGAFVGMFSETSLNIAIPQLEQAFHLPTSTIQWLVTGYMLVIGIVMPLSSIIGKWFTTRQVVIFAIVAFMIGSIISALAGDFAILLTGRMIQGIGTGLILPTMFATAMQLFPPQKLGAVNGVMALVIMFAPAIGPTLTGIILGIASWRWIFWTFVIFLAIALIFSICFVKNVGQQTKPPVDLLSICESIIGFSGIVAGASLASELGWLSWQVLTCFVVGIVVFILYCTRQLKLANPILNLKVMRNSSFSLGVAVVMLDFEIILSAMYLMPQFIQNAMGIAVALTGIIMLPGGIINALVSAIAGRMYDQVGAKLPATIGFIVAFVGALMLAIAGPSSSIPYIIIAHVVLMIGAPLAMSPAQTSALNSLQGPEAGDGSTIMNTLQQVVGALATALATSFMGMGQAASHGSSAARFANGAHYGFCFTIALIVIALILSFKLKGRKAQTRSTDIDLDQFK